MESILNEIGSDYGRSPSWGAWIEILFAYLCGTLDMRRSPSWGAWIEIVVLYSIAHYQLVAPPRGERGLKF